MASFPNYIECIQLLVRHSTPPDVITHGIQTAQTALTISQKIKEAQIQVNCDFILAGALLHDIGRCKSHKIDHGILGGQILREEGLPEEMVRIAENHLFAGITKHEATDLGLPFKNYLPVTLEEKIITFADNISKRDPVLTINEVLDRYSQYLSRSHPIIKRVRLLHSEIEKLMNDKQG